MKKGESLMTETTKQSLIQVSSNNINMQQFVKVFIQLENRTFSINVPLQSRTVHSLIIHSLTHFNQQYSLALQIVPENYAAYAARRNGNKCRDYPSLANNQNILLTNLKFYYLAKRAKQQKNVVYPLTQIKEETVKKQQKKVKKNAACFCIFL